MRITAAPALLALPAMLALAAPAAAQNQQPPRDDHLLRTPYITGTGATVDKPGEPQGSAPTPLDREIRKQDNAIDRSLCKGC